MAVLELPRGVALTPWGAATNRPRRYFVISTVVAPVILAAWLWISLSVSSGRDALIQTSDWILAASLLGFVVLGLVQIPAIRPGQRGQLSGDLCHRLTWATAALILPGAISGLLALTNSAGSALSPCVILIAFSARISHFYSLVMRSLDARPGDHVTRGNW